MRQLLDHLFNWKQNPASVFYFAVPLAVIGFSLYLTLGLHQWYYNGDPWYLVITLVAIGVLAAFIWRVRKPLAHALKDHT